MRVGARLLVTGFGPFPGAPANPTEQLVAALARDSAQAFGAAAFEAVVLPTEYRRSAEHVDQLLADLDPHLVVHFGLSDRIDALHIECVGRNRLDPSKPDAIGYAPPSACVAADGPDTLASTFPAEAILAALTQSGFAAALSDDAGAYVCNATLYRSLHAAPATRRVGFVHVPPEAKGEYDGPRLLAAAKVLLRAAVKEVAAEPALRSA